MTMIEYRAVHCRLWRRRLKAIAAIGGELMTIVFLAVLMLALIYLTPEQSSAECEYLAERLAE